MKKKQASKIEEKIFHRPITDPQGSYTGVPEDPEEEPVQDADDL